LTAVGSVVEASEYVASDSKVRWQGQKQLTLSLSMEPDEACRSPDGAAE
jgi:hypothetical protein